MADIVAIVLIVMIGFALEYMRIVLIILRCDQ
jgi:hypothetical protein